MHDGSELRRQRRTPEQREAAGNPVTIRRPARAGSDAEESEVEQVKAGWLKRLIRWVW